jgi:hypothetical protein
MDKNQCFNEIQIIDNKFIMEISNLFEIFRIKKLLLIK